MTAHVKPFFKAHVMTALIFQLSTEATDDFNWSESVREHSLYQSWDGNMI